MLKAVRPPVSHLRCIDFLLNHLKHVTGSRYAPWCSGPCASASTSFLDLRVSSTFSLCGTSSGTSAPTRLAVLSQLFCHTGLLRELLPAVGYALVSWVLGSQPLAVLSWVLGSQSLAVLLSSRTFGACFTQPNPMISVPTSPSESLLLFTPWNQLNFDVTGFKNTEASRDNRSCHFHPQLESSITLSMY